MKMRPLAPWLLAAGLATSLSALADTSTSADGFVVHHNAFTADTLSPAIAQSYGIQRSKARGVLNVSVIKEKAGTTGTPTMARVEVQAASLTGQKQRVPMREVREQEAVYYLGEFPVQDQETLKFMIEVTPEGATKAIKAETSQQFFTK
ncbi:MAG TPA: DUF4426 domain-containing protein [Lamprocystis sp. (in: g-proteobacteria)]|nr:DUF4426 domain-containing protein [Lamprocystis sp. (in: g-proteobacteria)]